MYRSRIKFCGVTRAEAALAAARVGADAIGLVFHSASGRNVTVEQAREILRVLPPFVTPVGLFVDASVAEVREITGRLGLRHVQLHGDEQPEMIAQLVDKVVLKAVHVTQEKLGEALNFWRNALAQYPLANIRGLLLETANATVPGGTGVVNDWNAIVAAREAGFFDGLPPMIAAGGLTPGNVGDVVRLLRPWAVDVSSGIEMARGLKSVEKMEAFVKAVLEAA